MRRSLWFVFVVASLVAVALFAAWREGWIRAPWSARYDELLAQLRDRGSVAVSGSIPAGMVLRDVGVVPLDRAPRLAAALDGRDGAAVASALRAQHLDGLVLRAGVRRAADATSVHGRLASYRPVAGLASVYLDEVASVVDPAEVFDLSVEDAQRLVTVARLILSGATAPPERLFPENLRRARPAEVALILRDGGTPILWRSTRSGSVARGIIDVSFAVLDRWTTRQQEQYGRMRDALLTKTVTVAIFYDRGVLGARDGAFLRRVADPRVWSVGYERVTSWEYSLPQLPGAPAEDPVATLRALTRERGVPPPGHLRPEITLYRFRALQMFERTPNGPVSIYNPQ
ncbi:MAG: hypothetical protein R3A48_14540 [Polyangiales bacterium]